MRDDMKKQRPYFTVTYTALVQIEGTTNHAYGEFVKDVDNQKEAEELVAILIANKAITKIVVAKETEWRR